MHQSVTIEQIQQRIALQEDLQAYEELYKEYYSGLSRFSYSIVKDQAAAEQIISNVFLKIWQIRKRLLEIENLKCYLYMLTKNFAVHFALQDEREIAIGLDQLRIKSQISFGNKEDLCISATSFEKLQQAIGQLSPACQLVFQLIKEDGFSYREAAEILNISPFLARNYLVQAIRKSAEMLPSYRQTAIPNIKSFSAS